MQPAPRWGGNQSSFPQQQQTFQARPQQPYQQPPQMHSTAPFQQQSPPQTGFNTQPISSLSPFIGRWWIKARVLDKSPIRTWNKPASQGKLFTMTLVDEIGDAIRATVFNEGADKYFDMVQNDQVYIFSKGNIKTANKKFSNLPCDYELSFDDKTEITPVADEGNIIRNKFSFVPIANLANKEKNTNVDLCAIVIGVGDVTNIMTRAGQSMRKRSITVGDQSGAQVELTLWEDKADQFNVSPGTPVIVKGARVGDFSGVSLSLSREGTISYAPEEINDVREVKELISWFTMNNGVPLNNLTQRGMGPGGAGGSSSADERKPFSVLKTENLGTRDDGKPDWFTVRATLTFVKQENMWYAACPNCNKKVNAAPDAVMARCDKCEKDVEQVHRFIISMTANDYSGNQWLTCFQDVAIQLLGVDAKTLLERQQTDPSAVANVVKQVCFKPYVIRVRVREEMVMDEKRLKCVVQRMEPVDFAKESALLLKEIHRYSTMPTQAPMLQSMNG